LLLALHADYIAYLKVAFHAVQKRAVGTDVLGACPLGKGAAIPG
jgi:hypothetical protein